MSFEPEKVLKVREPNALRFPTVNVPGRFRDTDIIEIRVTLTPLRWHEASEQHRPAGEMAGSQVQIVQLEARDSRAVFSIIRQLLRGLIAEFFGLQDVF